ncbi:MAG: hypothetical protein WCC74_01895 [Minisyncoccia bacterium]
MSVEFEEFKMNEMRTPKSDNSFVMDLIIKSGLAKSNHGANIVMIIISIICIAITIYFLI